jgi:hypothetical protein
MRNAFSLITLHKQVRYKYLASYITKEEKGKNYVKEEGMIGERRE